MEPVIRDRVFLKLEDGEFSEAKNALEGASIVYSIDSGTQAWTKTATTTTATRN